VKILAQGATWTRQGRQFVPRPLGWLRARGWSGKDVEVAKRQVAEGNMTHFGSAPMQSDPREVERRRRMARTGEISGLEEVL
jgi:hypothetical protein